MSLPADAARERIEVLRQSDAVQLFINRATQVRPSFTITEANAAAVAQICHELDGIPLAIEFVAARALAHAGELDAVGRRHLAYYVGLAERAEPAVLRAGRDDPVPQRLATELPNRRLVPLAVRFAGSAGLVELSVGGTGPPPGRRSGPRLRPVHVPRHAGDVAW